MALYKAYTCREMQPGGVQVIHSPAARRSPQSPAEAARDCISVFSGVGFGDLGLRAVGLRTVVAVEIERRRSDILRLNLPQARIEVRDASEINNWRKLWSESSARPKPFIALITPPCQAASSLGCRRSDRSLNRLSKTAVSVAGALRPDWVILENVRRYATQRVVIKDKTGAIRRLKIAEYLAREMESLGYSFDCFTLSAAGFGVPQIRTRWFAICGANGMHVEPPGYTHGPGEEFAHNTLHDAIAGLRALRAGQSDPEDPLHYARSHEARHIRWMRATPEGRSAFQNKEFRLRPTIVDERRRRLRLIFGQHNTYKRMRWDEPAPTITANSHKISGTNTVHPTQARVLSLRELLRVHGVGMTMARNGKPNYDDAAFALPTLLREPILRYAIGDAVPPRLIEVLAGACVRSSRGMSRETAAD
jgi:DNA (cytosine-5)-methyltransferase 1